MGKVTKFHSKSFCCTRLGAKQRWSAQTDSLLVHLHASGKGTGHLQTTVSAGTVIVLTTPDANRTMLSYLGSHEQLQLSEASRTAITRSRMLIIEGYLWEMPGALEAILAAISHARTSGCLVAIDGW